MICNPTKLDQELKAAGIPITGCDSTGQVWFLPSATSAQREQAAAIVAAHDPATTPEYRLDRSGHGRFLGALAILETHRLGAWGETNPPTPQELLRARAIVAHAGRAALAALRG